MKEKSNKKVENETETVTKIKEIIDSIRPYINMDGGDLEFIKFEDGYVFVKLSGHCAICELQDFTISNSLEATLQSEIEGIKGVINVDI